MPNCCRTMIKNIIHMLETEHNDQSVLMYLVDLYLVDGTPMWMEIFTISKETKMARKLRLVSLLSDSIVSHCI